MLKAAVVILNWNGKKYLEKFLPTLVKFTQTQNTEIIIADNNSKDDSIDFLNRSYPDIRQINFDQNYGFTGGYNKAFEQIEAKYYILLNSDIEVTENWLEPLLDLMDSDASIAACQPKVKAFHNKDYFEYAGAAGGFIDKFGYPFCRGRIMDTIEQDTGQYDNNLDVFWATGACMLVRSDLYTKSGGLDNDFFAHMEEIDLCWRLKNLGHRIVCCTDSEVYHVGGGTLPNNSPFKLYLNFRNNLFLLYKNLPKGTLFPILFSRMVLDGLSALTFLAKLSFKNFFAVLKAHMHFYKSLSKLRTKRKKLLNQAVNHHKEIYQKSIVIEYFLRKKHLFIDLNFK